RNATECCGKLAHERMNSFACDDGYFRQSPPLACPAGMGCIRAGTFLVVAPPACELQPPIRVLANAACAALSMATAARLNFLFNLPRELDGVVFPDGYPVGARGGGKDSSQRSAGRLIIKRSLIDSTRIKEPSCASGLTARTIARIWEQTSGGLLARRLNV